jgi:bacterioferritin-associated ferredoxin
MACTISPTEALEAAPTRPGRAMTRCACAGMHFTEIRRLVQEEKLHLDDLARRTGCGGTCTACLPDLRDFLAASPADER